MITPGSWMTLHEYGYKLYGIVTAVSEGNTTLITSQGVYSRPYSSLTSAPLYRNEELRFRLLEDLRLNRLPIRE